MDVTVFTIVIFLSMLIALATGLPVSFSLGGIAVIFSFFIWGGLSGVYSMACTAFGEMTSFIIVAVPCFILMGNILETSGLGDSLYEAVYRWMGSIKGGLAIGTVIICAIFAAMAGVSSVATVTMGLISLPAMLERNYSRDIVLGSISAGGSLGILIPPSVIMILYGVLTEESIGKLFAGGLIPGVMLAGMFCVYIYIRCLFQPQLGPSIEEKHTWREKIISLKSVILPALLILMVLGTIYRGMATPTEASALGAFGSLMIVVIQRKCTFTNMKRAFLRTAYLTSMLLLIMVGAIAFSHVIAVARVSDLITSIFLGLEINRWLILAGMQLVFFILGFFLDPVGIMMICTPIFIPIITNLGFDTVWFGVLFTVNMEMAYITPPFGFNLFIMKGIVPSNITMSHIYKSIIPFVIIEGFCIGLLMIFPQLVLWLPNKLLG